MRSTGIVGFVLVGTSTSRVGKIPDLVENMRENEFSALAVK